MKPRRRLAFPVAAVTCGLILACKGESPVTPGGSGAPGPGIIELTVSTTGPDIDPDGYQVILDGEFLLRVEANGSEILADVEAGQHQLGLEDVEINCTLSENPRSVTIAPGEVIVISFSAACSGVADSTGITTSDFGGMLGATHWTNVRGVTDDGALAGYGEFGQFGNVSHAFYRSPAGVWTDLNPAAVEATGLSTITVAWDISDNHRVVGTVHWNTSSQRPILWEEMDGTWSASLLPVESDPARGQLFGINKSGSVIAGAVNGPADSRGFRPAAWSESTPGEWEFQLLPDGGSGGEGVAHAVNDGDPVQAVGFVSRAQRTAVVWTRSGTSWSPPVLLPTPAGYGSEALGINRNGDVAGRIFPCIGSKTPVLWVNSGATWELVEITPRIPECGAPGLTGWAEDVSDSRQVVGAIDLSGQRPFLWSQGRLQLLAAGGAAWAINDRNQFAGMGSEYRHALLWTID